MTTAPTGQTLGARRLAYGWFDFANSSVTLIFQAYLFPLYVKQVLFNNSPLGDTAWGVTFAVSILIAAVIAPFIGRAVDGRNRMRVFAWFASGSFATAILLSVLIGSGTWLVMGTFVIANIAFYFASNMYDSLLTIIAAPAERTDISSFAWGFGYVGGVLAFAAVFFLQRQYGIESPLPYLFTAIFYTAFGFLALRQMRPFVQGSIRKTSVNLRQMFAALSRQRIRNLVGYWLIADCINAVIVFTSIYAATQLQMSASSIGVALLLVQLVAFPGTLLMNRIANRTGVLNTLRICVTLWCAVILILVFGRSYLAMGVIIPLTGLVIGSTQALMRAQYSLTVTKTRTSELFGWYALATESASFLSPLVFGLVSGLLGNQRLGMALLGVPLVFGMLLLTGETDNSDRAA